MLKKSYNIYQLLQEEETSVKKVPKWFGFAVGIVLMLIPVMITAIIFGVSAPVVEESVVNEVSKVMPMMSIISLILFVVGFFASKAIYFKTPIYANKEKTVKTLNTQFTREYEIFKKSLAQIENTFYFFPDDYKDPFSIKTICTYIINQRAHNMKEAINLYESELANQRQEMLMKEQLRKLESLEQDIANLQSTVYYSNKYY